MAVGRVRSRISPRALVWINRLSGAVLLAFGAVAILAAVGIV